MKILIADKFPENELQKLKKAGHQIDLKPDLKGEDLPGNIKGYQALIVRSTKVSAETLEACDALSLVIRAGAGVNTIDIQKAAELGIFVCNIPGKNAVAVAELAFGLLLALDRKIADNVADLRAGQWNKKKYSKSEGLMGKKVGIVGLGSIGQAFAKRAAAFGCHLYGIAKNRPDALQQELDEMGFQFVSDNNELAKVCDILSFHVPAGASTEKLIGEELLKNVKEGAFIINTSRGSVVDDEALIKAMDEKNVYAGLDVYNGEPGSGVGEFSTPLSSHTHVYGTHHIGASTEQAQTATSEEVLHVIAEFQKGNVLHCVNLHSGEPSTSTITVRHLDKVGVLASVLTVLKNNHINVEQMENKIFKGAKAAYAVLHTDSSVKAEVIGEIEKIEDVIQASLKLNS